MTINLGGVPIQDVRVAGAQAQRVMLGTGSTAVEVWSASPYPVSGTWAGNTTTANAVLATHTIAEDGVYNLTWAVTWAGTGNRFGGASIAKGASLTTVADGDVLNSAPGSSTATATAVALSAGEIISFRAVTLVGTFPATGAWTITKV